MKYNYYRVRVFTFIVWCFLIIFELHSKVIDETISQAGSGSYPSDYSSTLLNNVSIETHVNKQAIEVNGDTVVTVKEGEGFPNGQCNFGSLQEAIDDISVDKIRMVGAFTENVTIDRSVTIEGGWSDCFLGSATDNQSQIDGSGDSFSSTVKIVQNSSSNNSVILNNLVITGGVGGISISGGGQVVNINNSSIVANTRISEEGGGLSIKDDALVFINDTDILSNKAVSGGGVYCKNATVAVFGRSGIFDNTANGTAQFQGHGGGVYVDTGCQFSYRANESTNGIANNSAIQFGGGIYATSSTTNANVDTRVILEPVLSAATSEPVALDNPVLLTGNKAGTSVSPKIGAAIFASNFVEVEMQGVEISNHSIGFNVIGIANVDKLDINCNHYKQVCNFINNNHLISSSIGGSVVFEINKFNNMNNNNSISYTKIYDNHTSRVINLTLSNNTTEALQLSLEKSLIVGNTFNDMPIRVFGNQTLLDIWHLTYSNNNSASDFFVNAALGSVSVSHSILDSDANEFLLSENNGSISFHCTASSISEDITQYSGNTNTNVADFMFVDSDNNDYRLTYGSPAVDYCDQYGLDNGFDMNGDSTGIDLPSVQNFQGPFDIGADEFSDLIFVDGFE